MSGVKRRKGLVDAPNITYGGNSGHQAIHLARNWGAGRILLLGYDFGGRKDGSHFFGEHPQPLRSGHNYASWLDAIWHLANDLAAEGVEVINCSRETAITCFERQDIAEVDPN